MEGEERSSEVEMKRLKVEEESGKEEKMEAGAKNIGKGKVERKNKWGEWN